MIYYEISIPLTLIFKYIFVKILLLIMLFPLKISNILENKSQVFEGSDCTNTVHKYLYYNELKI